MQLNAAPRRRATPQRLAALASNAREAKKNVRCVSINDLDLTEEPEPTPSLPAETKKPQKEKEVNGAFRTELTVEVKGPTDVQISPDGSLMMVAQKDGDVSIVEDYESSNPQVSKAVTLTQICTNVERGISGAAFHPFLWQRQSLHLPVLHIRQVQGL